MKKSILPQTMFLSLVITVLLVLMCLLAVTNHNASNALADAQKRLDYTTDYYAAETLAAETLSSHSDGTVIFSLPINAKQELEIGAKISQGKIDVIKWNTDKR